MSKGGIAGLLHKLAAKLKPSMSLLQKTIRGSPVVHADETGWREAGQNGYVWLIPTPNGLSYFEYDPSRGGEVARRILGRNFKGVLVSDFYAGYNDCGNTHQRSWVHLLRDLGEIRKEYAERADVLNWCQRLPALYEAGRAVVERKVSGEARSYAYQQLVAAVQRLGLEYSQASQHPCHAKAQLVLRHQDELFQFVIQAGVAAHNNLAEQQIRAAVVRRKISGGSRSAEGSATIFSLLSLFQTWHNQHFNPFEQCLIELSCP